MLVFSRRSGEGFYVGDDIHVVVTEISGDKIKIAIDAPRSYRILRDELLQVLQTNQQSAVAVQKSALRNLAATLRTSSGAEHTAAIPLPNEKNEEH